MQIKYRKVISYFLITLMLFSGIFCENILEDSFFGYTTLAHSEASITSYNDTLIETAACTSEMLGVRTLSFVQQVANKSTQKTVFGLILDCILPDSVLHMFSSFFIVIIHIVQFRIMYGHTILVTYIHNKDGKKQLSSISI